MVRPRSASACMVSQKSWRARTSMPAVGSSRISSSGSVSRARAKRSRWRSPPEHFFTRRPASPVRSARSRAAGTPMWRRWQPATMATVSRTLRSSSRPPVCSTAPTRPWRTAATGSEPRTRTVPSEGGLKPRAMSNRVVLPAPLGPRRARTSPAGTVRSTPSTARTGPKWRVSPRVASAGALLMAPASPQGAPRGSGRRQECAMTDVMGGPRRGGRAVLQKVERSSRRFPE